MSGGRRGRSVRPQVVAALLRAHQRSSFTSLLWVRVVYRPNASEGAMAAREHLAVRAGNAHDH